MAGALVSLNSITSDSYNPNRVRNVVRYFNPSFTRILLNAEMILILVKYLIPFRLFKDSLIKGSR